MILNVIIKNKKDSSGFLYFLLIAFSQIVLSFEILSLFKLISKNGFFICNIAFFIISAILYIKEGKPLYKNEIKDEIKKK